MGMAVQAEGLRAAAPCGTRVLATNIRSPSRPFLTGSGRLAAAAPPAWLRRGGRRAGISAVRADGAVPPADDAAAALPPAGALQSHPLPDNSLPAAEGAETRGDFDSDTGFSVETADEGSRTGFSASTQPTALRAEPASPPQSLLNRVPGGAPGRLAAIGLAGFVGLTFLIALVRGVNKMRSPKAKRVRNINKNKLVVDTINRYFPQDRASFGQGEVRGLKMRSGFSGTEIFRKYLWYLLRERSFDVDAVADMQQLKDSLGLTDDEVGEALKERAERIYKDYGNVMLETEGMTKGGIERKATCRALFSKLLHLAESEELLPSADAAKRRSVVSDVFGATEDDASQLRIVSLYEVDAGRVDELASEPSNIPEDPNAEE